MELRPIDIINVITSGIFGLILTASVPIILWYFKIRRSGKTSDKAWNNVANQKPFAPIQLSAAIVKAKSMLKIMLIFASVFGVIGFFVGWFFMYVYYVRIY